MTDKEVSITRLINAPIEKVWDAWTNPESMKQWKSPEGMKTPEVKADLRVGGKYRIIMKGPHQSDPKQDGTYIVGGEYLEIEKPNKLIYTWLWEGAPAETHTTKVTILLKKIGASKTELTLIHNGFADDNMQAEHNKGWSSTLNKLVTYCD